MWTGGFIIIIICTFLTTSCGKLGMPTREPYSSSLTDSEWKQIEPLLPSQKLFGRPPRYHKRDILDALFYVVRTGCAWRLLPHDLPPWRIVYFYFMTWRREGIWQTIHDSLRDRVRLRSGKKKPRLLRSSILRALKVSVIATHLEKTGSAGRRYGHAKHPIRKQSRQSSAVERTGSGGDGWRV